MGESDGGVEGGFGRDGSLPGAGIFIDQELAEAGVVDGVNKGWAILVGGLGEGMAVGGGEQGEVAAEIPEAVEVAWLFALGPRRSGNDGDVVHSVAEGA